MFKVKIQNMPAYAKKCEFVVAREYEREFWFYGAYDDSDKAEWVAQEIRGYIFHNTKFKR